jgi:O-succinylbenzoic acid--CoA ligase
LIARVKSVLVGGGFVPQDLIERAVSVGLKIHTTYGSTEMASQVTTTAESDPSEKLYTSGRVLDYREIRTDDSGEIMVRGETLFKGYVTSSGLRPGRDEQGWFATGDLGRIDSEGYLHVTGRKDNMFISGGENVYPEEIETVMLRLSGVADVVVVAVDDEKFGQRPVAFVKFASGVSPAVEKLQELLGNWLPKFKIPVQILDWPDEPPGGKLKRDRQYFKNLARGIRL